MSYNRRSFDINNNESSLYNDIKHYIDEIKLFINDGYALVDGQEEHDTQDESQEGPDTPEGEEPKKYLNKLLENIKNKINSLKTKSNDKKEEITQLLNEFAGNIDFKQPFKLNLSDKLNELSSKLNNLLNNPYKKIDDDNNGIELSTTTNINVTTTIEDINEKYSKALNFAKKYSKSQ